METTINQRFKIICEKEGLNVNSFSKRIETAQPTVKSIFDGKTKPSYDTIVKVIIEFSLNANWLILDRGDMYIIENTIIDNDVSGIKIMLQMISDLSAKNALLEKEKQEYKEKEGYLIAAEEKVEYKKE